jgi:carbon storage regulator CsrA
MESPIRSFFAIHQGSVSMLVLTRKYQEKIRIGDNITITVLRTKGKAVRLGIEAPANVPVVRGELKFEPEVVNDEPALVAAGTAPPTASGREKRSRPVAAESAWMTRSRNGAARREHRLADAEIEHRRVPRAKVGQVLPRLIPGNGAMREMLDQRSASV